MPRKPASSAAPFIPDHPTLPKLIQAAHHCAGCDLYKRSTQTVFGEGAVGSLVMFVGEQPGDKEDLSGRPFVGPAGALLDRALIEAGIDRERVYVTNAVKHFKWEPRGKRRIHKKPNAMEIAACRPWLDAEIQAVRPTVVVCLGATAAQSLLGRDFRVTQRRGEMIPGTRVPFFMATVHPSSVLRAPDERARHDEYTKFVADLKQVAGVLHEKKAA